MIAAPEKPIAKNSIRVLAPLAAWLLSAPLTTAWAQGLPEPLSVRPQTDQYGVSLTTAKVLLAGLGGVSIGQPGAGGLSFSFTYTDSGWPGWRPSTLATLSSSGSTYTVSLGGSAETFTKSGSTFTSDQGTGATLVYQELYDAELGIYYFRRYDYTDRNGIVYRFDKQIPYNNAANEGVLTQVTYPSREIVSIYYKVLTIGGAATARIQSVGNNLGYRIHFEYARDSATHNQFPEWRTLVKATAFDLDVDSCSASANSCTFSQTWPSVAYTGTEFQVTSSTDALGRTTTYSHDGDGAADGDPAAGLVVQRHRLLLCFRGRHFGDHRRSDLELWHLGPLGDPDPDHRRAPRHRPHRQIESFHRPRHLGQERHQRHDLLPI